MKTSDLVYRRMDEADLEHVVRLEAEAFPTPWTVEQYVLVMRRGGCVVFGAWDGDLLAGYIAVAIQGAVGEMEVYNIAVAETYRQKGIGKKLMSLALAAASRIGVERAVLEVRVSNAPARALYRSLGFQEAGVRKRYYHDTGEDALVLARSDK